ncbi:hypothetical protein [Methylobacterium sp. WL9]|uniref:hypothetical protein n=1 Tax=Methylobacterium sp. WL9 TaxID=2603898 RepID=UPI0011D73B2F|nr:hypothetical protein [Methylobacterium sp. WL9]TXN22153.1 hypothetical protein FV217_11810 [Methylobacterium sp. WL9]
MKRHLAAEGVYGGEKRPFGWRIVDGRLVEDTEEQPVLQTMVRMQKDGASLREIGQATCKEATIVNRILFRTSGLRHPVSA